MFDAPCTLSLLLVHVDDTVGLWVHESLDPGDGGQGPGCWVAELEFVLVLCSTYRIALWSLEEKKRVRMENRRPTRHRRRHRHRRLAGTNAHSLEKGGGELGREKAIVVTERISDARIRHAAQPGMGQAEEGEEEAQKEAVGFFPLGCQACQAARSSSKTRLFDHDKRCQQVMTYWVRSAFVLASDGIAMRQV